MRANRSCDLGNSHSWTLAENLEGFAAAVAGSPSTAWLAAGWATSATRASHGAVSAQKAKGPNEAFILFDDRLDLVNPRLNVLHYCVYMICCHVPSIYIVVIEYLPLLCRTHVRAK